MRIALLMLAMTLPPVLLATDALRAPVRTAPATAQALRETLTAYGEVQPDGESVRGVNAGSAGQVARLWVRTGQLVAAGEPLVDLDTDPNARLGYEQARGQLAYAEAELARTRDLFTQRLATRAQVASAEKILADARSALATEQSLGAGATRRMIRAPFAGIVSRVDANPGDRVAAGFNLLNLAAREKLVAVLGVEPEDAPRIPANATVVLAPVFEHGPAVSLSVGAVHGMVNPNTRLVDVLVALHDAASKPFLPGVRVRAEIMLREVRALAVPRAALLNDGRDYLFVVREGRAHRVDIERGIEWQGMVQIDAPLRAGDRVVIEGNAPLSERMLVMELSP